MMNKNNSYCLTTTALLLSVGVVSSASVASWVSHRLHMMDVSTRPVIQYPPHFLTLNSVGTIQQANVILTAKAPNRMSLAGERINWILTSVNNGKVYSAQGVETRLQLPKGSYKIQLAIGKYRTSRTITLEGTRTQQEDFIANIGRIIASANESVQWTIESLEGGETIRLPEQTDLNIIVAAGLYKIDASLKGLHRAERVRVGGGEQVVSNLFIPAGRVNLIATRGNAPLFKPTKWNIYRIENGEKRAVGEYNRHVQAVTMPPGHYEAVAKSEDIVRSREFWVGSGATNDVQVSMD